jgi:hypothetical protein
MLIPKFMKTTKNFSFFKPVISCLPVAHTCNLSYLGGWVPDDGSSRPTQANSLQDPISEITRAKWSRGGPGCRVPALEVRSPELKPQSHQKQQQTKYMKVDLFFFIFKVF